MAALQGGAILPELCVYITLQYLAGDCTPIYFILLVFCNLRFIMYYGRQSRQLSAVPNLE